MKAIPLLLVISVILAIMGCSMNVSNIPAPSVKIAVGIDKEIAVYNNYDGGFSKEIKIILPEGTSYLCLADKEEAINCKIKRQDGQTEDCSISTIDSLLEKEMETDKNLFFIPISAGNILTRRFNINKFNLIGANPLCFENYAPLVIQSKGGYVDVN